MAAAGTEPVQFKAVGLNGESVPSGNFFLQTLDVAVLKFDDFSTTRANEVIVMALVRNVVVLRLRSKVAGLRQSGVAKEIERSVDGGQSKVRVGLGQLMIHRFGRDVLLPEKGAENEFSLTGEFQLVFGQVILKCIHFLRILARCHGGNPPTEIIKDETLWPVKGAH